MKQGAKVSLAMLSVIAFLVALVWAMSAVVKDDERCRNAGGVVLDYGCYEAKSLHRLKP